MADAFKPCSVAGCNGNAHRSRYGCAGMCSMHYQRFRAHGDPLVRTARSRHSDFKCSVIDCSKQAARGRRGFCQIHYKRFWRYRDALGGGTKKNAIPKWLADHVNYDGDDCLIWPFAKSESGYPICDAKWGSGIASRVMCVMAHGEPPSPECEASHSCGNGNLGCMNPKHLRWLVHADNMAETLVHGTHNRGERNGQSVLTANDIRRIRALDGIMLQTEIADHFGITAGYVSHIISRTAWAWLQD